MGLAEDNFLGRETTLNPLSSSGLPRIGIGRRSSTLVLPGSGAEDGDDAVFERTGVSLPLWIEDTGDLKRGGGDAVVLDIGDVGEIALNESRPVMGSGLATLAGANKLPSLLDADLLKPVNVREENLPVL